MAWVNDSANSSALTNGTPNASSWTNDSANTSSLTNDGIAGTLNVQWNSFGTPFPWANAEGTFGSPREAWANDALNTSVLTNDAAA